MLDFAFDIHECIKPPSRNKERPETSNGSIVKRLSLLTLNQNFRVQIPVGPPMEDTEVGSSNSFENYSAVNNGNRSMRLFSANLVTFNWRVTRI